MFYSHEVLTSRKYGVATVWLVATLGAKSTLKKINRKAIREVNVPKACQTIIDPGAPMALRLQGNLLYGVSRVYMEQCTYVLSDAQNAHTSMRMMLRVIKGAAIDPEAGRARPEQLMLQDDPSYLPEFALPPQELLAGLSLRAPIETPRAGESQSLTPFGSEHSPGTPVRPLGGLVIPFSSSGPVGEFRMEDDGAGSLGRSSAIPGAEGAAEPAEPLLEDFGFDDDGNFIDYAAGEEVARTPANARASTMPSDAGASARVRQEHEDGQRPAAEQFDDQMDLDLPIFGDDLPEGEAFAVPEEQPISDNAEVDASSAAAAAPMQRKKRTAKIIPADYTMELRNKDLSDWNNNYRQNMAEASRHKNNYRVAAQAKKNAEYWVWGAGIGGIGRLLTQTTGPTPFDMLYGDNLFELYTGTSRNTLAGKKHDRDSGIDEATEGESRRVRPRQDEDEAQIGRGADDEGMFMPEDEEVELPRDAPSALDDQQMFSAMPWNISASNRGSSAVPRSGRVGMPGSVGPSTGPHGSFRIGSRMVSASPLQGRGQPGGLEAIQGFDEENEFDLEGSGLPAQPSSDGVYPEPEDLAGASVRVRESLSAEGGNFLAFISDAITEKRTRIQASLEHDPLQAEAAADVDEVLFEDILPPAENSRMVACQGLMMVLSLGTRGMLSVRQDGGFEEIGLSLTEKGKAMRVEEVVGEEQGDVEVEGDFDEQMATGAAVGPGGDDDDNNSLYADP